MLIMIYLVDQGLLVVMEKEEMEMIIMGVILVGVEVILTLIDEVGIVMITTVIPILIVVVDYLGFHLEAGMVLTTRVLGEL